MDSLHAPNNVPPSSLPEFSGEPGHARFLQRVLIVAVVAALALFLWLIRDAVLLGFAGVLVAVLLRGAAHPLERRLGLGAPWALLLVGLGILGVLALVGGLVGAEVASQAGELAQRLPEAARAFEERFGVELPTAETATDGLGGSLLGNAARQIAQGGLIVANGLSALVVMVIGGVFLALNPGLYRKGALRLVPSKWQERIDDALLASGEALRAWLLAQSVSMVMIGLGVGLGSWWIGLPGPLALGLFAGLAGFIPLLGGVVGAIPALLLALTVGMDAVLWTALLILAVQQVESNMIMPLVEHRLVSIPPALLIFALVAAGTAFGLAGVLLGAPLTVVAFVLVAKLYVRGTLQQPAVVPGEQ